MSTESNVQSDVDTLLKEVEDAPKASESNVPSDVTILMKELPKATQPGKRVDECEQLEIHKPKNLLEWQHNTQANVCRVEALTRSVFDQVNQNSVAEQAARKAVQEHAKHQKAKQRTKVNVRVKVHQESIRKTYKCMKEIDHAVVQVEGASGRLTAERYACFARAKVSEYRLELREKRPPVELFRDGVGQALEKETQALNNARKELLESEGEAKRIMEELQNDWNALAKDIGNRRLAMRHDLGTIGAAEDCELYDSEDVSEKRSNEIATAAYKSSADGLKLKDLSEVIVKRIKSQAAALNKIVDQVLAKHTLELSSMKTSLALRIVESEGAIDKAGTQLRHMEQRAEMGDKTMNECIATLKALLRDLHANRQNSVKDLRNKTIALDIDNSCRKVTPQVAIGTNSVEPANKKLGASLSAPALGASVKINPTGEGWPKSQHSGNPQQNGSGNPQQGDVDQKRQAMAKEIRAKQKQGNARPTPSPTAGGSHPLKAAAAAVVQG